MQKVSLKLINSNYHIFDDFYKKDVVFLCAAEAAKFFPKLIDKEMNYRPKITLYVSDKPKDKFVEIKRIEKKKEVHNYRVSIKGSLYIVFEKFYKYLPDHSWVAIAK